MATPVITFDRVSGTVVYGDKCAQLSPQQARMFFVLSQHRTVERDSLYAVACPDADQLAQIIASQVYNIRGKLRRAGIPLGINPTYGVGYSLTERVQIIAEPTDITLRGDAPRLLRELLSRCADRPADAMLAERVRQAVFGS